MTLFFVLTMPLFALLAHAGVSIAFAFFIWVGIYGVMVVSQMWAFAADSFNVKSGQRLFVVIMLGANLGALAGAKVAAAGRRGAVARRADGARRRDPGGDAVPGRPGARGGAGGFACRLRSSTAGPCRACSAASASCCATATCC